MLTNSDDLHFMSEQLPQQFSVHIAYALSAGNVDSHVLLCSGAAAECFDVDMTQSPEQLASEVSFQSCMSMWAVAVCLCAVICSCMVLSTTDSSQMGSATLSGRDLVFSWSYLVFGCHRSSGFWAMRRRWLLLGLLPHAKLAPGLKMQMLSS